MRRAALLVLLLALLAGVVAGREPARPEAVVPQVQQTKEEFDLDLAKLTRQRRETELPDLFAVPAPPAPPQPVVVQKVEPPPAPKAPPLPFKYLGRLEDGGKVAVFLARDQEALSVTAGATLSNVYRIENITESAVHFIYLPLGEKQELRIQ